jgi:antitoxin PrlF
MRRTDVVSLAGRGSGQPIPRRAFRAAIRLLDVPPLAAAPGVDRQPTCSHAHPQELNVRKTLLSTMTQVATVTSKGQVTLPASVRKKLGIRRGSRIVFLESGEEIRMLREEELEERFSIFDRRRKEAKLTPARLEALVEEAKRRVWKRHHAAGR